ncbi:hypothetical protein [Flavivirga spongiicola]|uniref:GDSL-like lipase/acylhydrolase family protein n=1 Tax=Flavivirga spongiicola TaxID=421621 RepID=A0ABU7XVH2_9FLAO|nr:hypothetical protein [Flavivirga sp. MEBiC05379]MDO5978843.1 hypothetical protein [Flavivirga sp. MEBiC05379]
MYANKEVKIINFDVEEGVDIKDSISKGFIGYKGAGLTKFGDNRNRCFVKANNFTSSIISSFLFEEIIHDLESFIGKLQSSEVTPIFFTTPTYKNYNIFLSAKVIEENTKDLLRITQKYNLEYWNYVDSDFFEKSNFFDSNHLNKKGAIFLI